LTPHYQRVFGKKLAYYYIRRAQSQFSIAIDEPYDWNLKICAINDTKKPVSFSYQVNCLSNGNELIAQGNSVIGADSVATLSKIPYSQSDKKFYIIKWSSDLGEGVNHYLAGNPPFDLKQYLEWISQAGFYKEYLGETH
jgi:beta-mannosidase